MSRRSLWNTLYIYTSCFGNVACTFKYSILETDGGKSLRKMLEFKNLMASERSHINIRSLYSAKTLLLTPMPQFRERISDHISDFRNCKQRWDSFFRVFSCVHWKPVASQSFPIRYLGCHFCHCPSQQNQKTILC